MSALLVRDWLAAGELDLPLPGQGATADRWERLSALAEVDLVAARLAEAHTDAAAILAELGGPAPAPDQLWGVWAAESSEEGLTATDGVHGVLLDGTKPWCSGAGLCSHALVTAHRGSGQQGLYAVDLSAAGVRGLPGTWVARGMAESDTRAVEFTAVPAVAVGGPGEYLSRPGFWHGAIGVAACWLGGARAVGAVLYERVRSGRADAHTAAHLGAVDAALSAAAATLTVAAKEVDADPANRSGRAELVARRARAVVETAVDETLTRTARALGPAPLCLDDEHAQRVADLSVYVRQSHAERDLERLGVLAAEAA
ncbi:acyl-CoA dehydrogenase [Mycolicibacterium duvalii]|uniref:Dehydrogenase n=1 Tax=Mycolicibacterium duvalii TaxID=39688 RepID=A0A7I7K5F8_9MYCO|nr:acyl-CoA/acyl-ACP dehydrogenase [Mycolicibacterium duvalii]MCV7367602.1 acyl-CoA dehydrogenase [Mycolicibacterium duvalii]PEG44091.1 acyl-CoA dehydrogenase [Mycolicibacterium duvalii]BBX18808.1 dehydrogenase [Mycolicibacterium duvalii]